MPHLIIEYSDSLLTDEQVRLMIESIHAAVIETALFKRENIKIRFIPIQFYKIGDGDEIFLHAQLRIKPGRSKLQKKLLSGYVLNAIKKIDSDVDVITVEISEMDADSYNKYSK